MQQKGANICPPVFQMNATQNSNQNNHTNTQKNRFRNYENQNYCWTHGHHVKDNHTSATCTMPKPGHQFTVTKLNTMGGSEAGIHKTIMPSQSGRRRITMSQRPPSQTYLAWKAAGFPASGMKPFYEKIKAQRKANKLMQQSMTGAQGNMWVCHWERSSLLAVGGHSPFIVISPCSWLVVVGRRLVGIVIGERPCLRPWWLQTVVASPVVVFDLS